jgi:hypothetical protein
VDYRRKTGCLKKSSEERRPESERDSDEIIVSTKRIVHERPEFKLETHTVVCGGGIEHFHLIHAKGINHLSKLRRSTRSVMNIGSSSRATMTRDWFESAVVEHLSMYHRHFESAAKRRYPI